MKPRTHLVCNRVECRRHYYENLFPKAIGSSVVASYGGLSSLSVCFDAVILVFFCLFLSYFFPCAVDLTALNRLVFKSMS